MAVRRRKKGGLYFDEVRPDFIPSGCTVLDCVLGGGWPLGRISNVVGDKAVGKTLLAIEACANFALRYPDGRIWYREAESAFDVDYAEDLGLPTSRVDFGPEGIDTSWDTLDDVVDDMLVQLDAGQDYPQGLYIIDSLDALSSRAELKRVPGEGTFALEKQKILGELFRRHRNQFKTRRVHVMFVSQIRDKIGVMFGDKHTRAGGKALDFYASQILWLHHIKIIKRKAGGVERPTAVRIRAKCKKNKVAPSFRECEFALRFGYGVEDLEASLAWLKEVQMLDRMGLNKDDVGAYLRRVDGLSPEEAQQKRQEAAAVVRKAWGEVEDRFKPTKRKYA